jgi:hypothetical protein
MRLIEGVELSPWLALVRGRAASGLTRGVNPERPISSLRCNSSGESSE